MYLSRPLKIVLMLSLLCFSAKARADVNYGNSLPATDGLGRALPTQAQAGPQKERYVGMFYWIWHDLHLATEPYVPTDILKEHPEAKYDFDNPCWPQVGAFWWGEPLWGFYRDTDKWVIGRNAQLLSDAGVDVIFFDTTNGSLTFDDQWEALCETYMELRSRGVNTPKISFLLPFSASDDARISIINLYTKLYRPGKYADLFFLWDGKPLLMAYPESLDLPDKSGKVPDIQKEAKAFFTFRPGQPVYNRGPKRDDHWGWLEIFPQHGFGRMEDGRPEEMTVGVSQNWAKGQLNAMNAEGAFGRSYTHANGFPGDPEAVARGLNFQEQWDRAIEADPQIVFVTGWNEWMMGRYRNWQGQPNAFPDQYDQEHSRDIEPMKGGHGDNYYYQLVANIRRFKGMPSRPSPRCRASVSVDGRFDDWKEVDASYSDPEGDTMHRDSKGWGSREYRDDSGRNDIVEMKVADDSKFVYFYVRCAEDISPCSDPAWMRLFIDTDCSHATGWEGYDYVLNRVSPRRGRSVLEKCSRTSKYTRRPNKSGRSVSSRCLSRTGGRARWRRAGRAAFSVHGPEMELAVPKRALGIRGDAVRFQFKWADNLRRDGDVMEFLLSGDSAPLGRFNFPYGDL